MKTTRLKIYLVVYFALLASVAQAQIVRTIAGTGICSDASTDGDGGPAINANLGNTYGVAVDTNGNVYFSDAHFHVVKKIDRNGVLSTFAGNGYPICTNDNGLQATAAHISNPTDILIDPAGNVFIGDAGNKLVRKVTPAGIITTVAGHCGSSSINGDGGQATNAGLGSVSGLAMDAAGNLYIANGNATVRKVDMATGIITTVIGNGNLGYSGNGGQATAASFDGLCGIAIDAAGNMYTTEKTYSIVRKINTSGIVSLFAGTYNSFLFAGDGGPATSARVNGPGYMKFDAAGNVYISDYGNNRIRKVNTAGIISTVVGPLTGTGTAVAGFAGDGGPPVTCKTQSPTQFCFDSRGNMYIADQGNYCSPSVNNSGHRIRQIFKVDTIHLSVAPGNVLCGNTAATYTANLRYAYYNFVYKWKINGVPAGTNAPTLSSTMVHNSDTITCSLVDTAHGGMLLAVSDTIIMTVLPPILPVLTVTSTGDTVCAGLPITFTATAINGGTAPIFNWKVNGIYRYTGPVFTYIPATGDIVTCILISNDPCAFPPSTQIVRALSVIPSYLPSVVVTPSPDSVAAYWSQIINLITTVTYGGSHPTFQWYNMHGPILGATSSSYSETIYAPDTIYCVVHSNFFCAVPDVDTSNIMHIGTGLLAVGDPSTQSASFTIYPNPNNGSFTLIGKLLAPIGNATNIEIRNVLGQVVYRKTMHPTSPDIEIPVNLGADIPTGMYYLITGDDKGNRATQFIVR